MKLASLDADSLGNQIGFAKGFGEMGAKRLGTLEAELSRRKVSSG